MKQNLKSFYSPSNLIRFMESPFASWMDRYALDFPLIKEQKDPQDPLSSTLQKRGFVHEAELERAFKEQGLSVVRIEGSSEEEKFANSIFMMKQGADVIVQARLQRDNFGGFSDFLVKVPGRSKLGEYHYEVWDTKLTKQLKPHHVVQLCCYAEMLEAIQGVISKNVSVVLGNKERKSLRTSDYFHYYLRLKNNFLKAQRDFDPKIKPDPADFKNCGDWSNYAQALLKERDHLSQVASILRSQIKKLNEVDIRTIQQLASTDLDRISGINSSIYLKLQKQASIQQSSLSQSKPAFEVIEPLEGEVHGFCLLPPASQQDVFFDIEGFPLYDEGLEYLWGCTYFNDSGERDFIDFWAHDREEEKQAFQSFISWVYVKWQRDPSMHIYHFANYEITACRKLMGRFGVCEDEVDQLLRNNVFVDLYKVVKTSLLVGEPRYSIKNIEKLYREKRKTDVGSGGDSIVAYEKWRELFTQGLEGKTWQDSASLKSIRDYNIEDCESTQELTDWLREQQKAHKISYLGLNDIKIPDVKEEITARTQLRDRLLAKASQISDPLCKTKKLTENLAWVLEFHRREVKPAYWRFFDRLGLSYEELFDDLECLAFCKRTSRKPFLQTPRTKNYAYEYRFDPYQEFKGNCKKFKVLGEDNVDVDYLAEESNLENGLIVLKSKQEPDSVITLISNDFIPSKPIPEAIQQLVTDYEAGELKQCAIIDFLNRSQPRIKGHVGGEIITSDDPDERMDQIVLVIENLNNSYLTIQGPPGSGKSYTAKHAIASLLKKGFKIGIASNSHKAINHLLLNTARYCKQQGIKATFTCTKETDDHLKKEDVMVVDNNQIASHVRSSCVLGTTAWGFARDDMCGQLDYLFVDEAGQVCVANLIAMSRSSKNLVLMGDQMQLGQPTQATHPAESGQSILDYLLHETPTISNEMGVFLGTTYRMHSALNSFISEHIYDGKLKSHPNTDKRIVKLSDNYKGKLNKEAGIIFVPVHHEGNRQTSEEEVEEIQVLVKELFSRKLITENSIERNLTWDDILFLSPYNHQCRKLQEALGLQAKVGTIDKFQGQEAPVIFLSMCTSDANESPRGLEFLLNKNRLNVAISRAQSLAIVVGNPNLAEGNVGTVSRMKLISLYNSIVSN